VTTGPAFEHWEVIQLLKPSNEMAENWKLRKWEFVFGFVAMIVVIIIAVVLFHYAGLSVRFLPFREQPLVQQLEKI
jgi:hypothetical protein